MIQDHHTTNVASPSEMRNYPRTGARQRGDVVVADSIQAVVDALATRLGRSVAVDDPAIRSLNSDGSHQI